METAGEKSDFCRHRLSNLEPITCLYAQLGDRDKKAGVSQKVGTDV
jgi:hypothetical protein